MLKEMEMEGEKGIVCVTGGTGYVASWLIMRLLQHGYSVNTTIRFDPDRKKDISYLTNLAGASERLRIFNADLDKPESFDAPIEGCMGVFHVAHPIDFEEKEDEETKTRRAISGTTGILQACLNSKTVKKVVYTSSVSTVMFSGKDLRLVDETAWSDVDFVTSLKTFGGSYYITKTLTEKAALEFAERHGLDLVSLIPAIIHGPFISPHCASSVHISMTMFLGEDNPFEFSVNNGFVHVDDVVSAHIFLLEYPNAKGRYICSAVEKTMDELYKFLSARYPEYQIPVKGSLKQVKDSKYFGLSSEKLLDTGFRYKYGLEEMYDDAIQCCKQKGLL